MSSARGQQFESAALTYLLGRGLKLLERNFSGRFGEIDLIMADGAVLVFVEVRARTESTFGDGLDSISTLKRRKIVRTAQLYLAAHPRHARSVCRFDVVALDAQGIAAPTWLKSAFE